MTMNGFGIARFNLTWRITLAVGAALLAGIATTAVALNKLRSVNAEYTSIMKDKQVQRQDQVRVIQLTFKTQVQEWKNLLLRGYNYEDFQKYEKAFREQEKETADLAAALLAEMSDPKARELMQGFIASHAKMGMAYGSAIKVFGESKGRDFAGADALVKGQDREPTQQLDALAVRQREVLTEVQDAVAAGVASTIRTMAIAITVVFALVVAVVVVIVRFTRNELVDLTHELTQAAHSTGSGASQVATSAQALSQGATEQAASVEETSASMEEMSSMTRKNAENSQSAAGLMAGVDAKVQDSNRALGDMVSAMTGIRESSQQVARIIKTIDEIAFQTNILALNAAVEAARAGEAGMGFAVVADEVRNLAQRSAQAARDTATLIEESIGRAQEGTQRVEHVAQSIGGITDSVTTVKGLVEEVSVASQQQSQGIDQVSQAIAQIEKVTQQTAATAEESAAASEELSAQAEAALSAVRKLERIVGVVSVPAAAAHSAAAPARRADVVPMRESRTAKPKAAAAPTPEDVLPLGDTGTYGRF